MKNVTFSGVGANSMAGSDGCTVVENVVRVVSVEEHVVLGIIVTCLAVVFGALLVILCCCCCTKKKRKVDEVGIEKSRYTRNCKDCLPALWEQTRLDKTLI